MRTLILLTIAFVTAFVGVACAREPLLILNTYTPPVPALTLISISPNNHAQLNDAPASVKLSFNEALDETGSNVTVYDPYSNPIATSGKMTQTTQLEAALSGNLLNGAYRIEWKAACACEGHAVISGTSYFTIYK